MYVCSFVQLCVRKSWPSMQLLHFRKSSPSACEVKCAHNPLEAKRCLPVWFTALYLLVGVPNPLVIGSSTSKWDGEPVYLLVCLCICTFVKSTDNPQKAKKSDQFNLSRVERKDEKEEQVTSLQLQKLFCMFKPNIVSYGAIPLSLNLQRKLWTVWLHLTALLKLGCSSQLCLCRGRGTFL